MQENTESEKPEDSDSVVKEEGFSDAEEAAAPENSANLDSEFEDQEGELLHPEEKKKSGAGKVFLFLLLVLAGSGGYLYFNNLIPAEILNLVNPQSAPSKPPALVTPTPSFVEEEVAEIPEPVEVSEAVIAEPVTIAPPEIQEAHLSGAPAEPVSPAHISGTGFDQAPQEDEVAEEPQETASPEEPEPVIEQAVDEEFTAEPETETITPLETEESTEPDAPQRSKAAQAYLDFIESSVQKLGEWIKEGFNWGWDYLNKKIS